MRKELKSINKQRLNFSATVERFGFKSAFRGPDIKTILLKNVKTNGKVLTDHLWLTCGKWSEKLNIGDIISFDARVSTYTKGYKGYRDDIYDKPVETDYRLERPTKIRVTNTTLC